MNFQRRFCCASAIVLLWILLLVPGQGQAPKVRLLVQTALGNLEVELDAQRAPVTVANFLQYVDGGHFTGGRFHRTVKRAPDNQPHNAIKIEVIQADANPALAMQAFPPIPLERTNITGLKHLNGTLSMARAGTETATSDFFICLGAQPDLDFGGRRNPDGQGFAAFGQVIKGLDVVKKIQQAPANEQALTPPVKILAIIRIK